MTDSEYQNMIKLETGVIDGVGNILIPIIDALIPMWWQSNIDIGKKQRLNYLYTTQSVILYFLASYKKMKDIRLGTDQFRAQQVFANTILWLGAHNKRIEAEDLDVGVPQMITIMPRNLDQERMAQDWVLERVLRLDPNFERNYLFFMDSQWESPWMQPLYL